MEKLLLRLARQLDALDEASLMALWSKYATMTSRFEPTRRWEEGALVFSLIQAKHWKNQLFNYCWRQQRLPGKEEAPDAGNGATPHGLPPDGLPPDGLPRVGLDAMPARDGAAGADLLSAPLESGRDARPRPCRVLAFRSVRPDVPASEPEEAAEGECPAPDAASGTGPQADADSAPDSGARTESDSAPDSGTSGGAAPERDSGDGGPDSPR